MSKESSLIKNTIIVTVGKICTQFISFFLLPLYTSLLSTQEYGVVDLLNTLINLMLPILVLQIDQGTFRYLIDCRDSKTEQNKLLTVTLYFTLSQIIIYTFVFFLFNSFIHNEYKYFLLTNLICSLLSSVFLQISRGLGDNGRYAIGSFLAGAFTVIFNVIFIVFFHFGAYGMLMASLLANLICSIYIFISLKIYKCIKPCYYSKDILYKLLRYSIPLVPNVISWWIINASDRVIISFFMDLSANGIYSAANKFSGVITTLYSVFNLTWTESASVNIDSDDRDEFFSKILDIIIRIFGSICLLVISFMPFIFPIMINSKFKEAYYQIPILIVATMFNILISFYGSIYVAKKKTKEIAKTSFFAAIINIIINCTFIKYIGLYAASLSTLIAYFSMFLYRSYDVKKYVHIMINHKIILSMVFIYIFIIIIYFINIFMLNVFMAVVTTIYSFLINKNNIITVYILFKNKYMKGCI